MKIVIRNKIFETNSSASHTITLSSSHRLEKLDNLPDTYFKEVTATGIDLEQDCCLRKDHGWGNKFQFMITEIFGYCKTEEDIRKYMKNASYKMLKKVMKKYGKLKIVWDMDRIDFSMKYDDPIPCLHCGGAYNTRNILKNEIALANFLFSTQCYLVTDKPY